MPAGPVILHVFPSFEIGGAQRRFAAILNHGGDHAQHHVLALDGHYDAAKLLPEGRVRYLFDRHVPKEALAAVLTARGILKAEKPDLLVTYNWGSIEFALAAALMPGLRHIHVQDGFSSDEMNAEKTGRRLMRALAYRRADRVIVPSRTLEAIARKSWGISDKRLSYIPNGIELKRFDRAPDAALLKAHGLSESDMIVGTVAGLRVEKNIGRLIEAFTKVLPAYPQAKLVIAGDGVGRSAMKMLVERIGIKPCVVFTGNVPEPERLIPAFDIFALSSDTEQMPLAVIEAMAAGLPVASTDVGDVADMVADANKPFIKGREAGTLAESLSALLADPQQAAAIGAANRAKAHADFDLQKMVAAYEAAFTSCLKR